MELQKKFYTINEVVHLTGSSLATVYRLRERGVLQFRKFGGKTVVMCDEFDRLIHSLPVVPAEPQPHHHRSKARA